MTVSQTLAKTIRIEYKENPKYLIKLEKLTRIYSNLVRNNILCLLTIKHVKGEYTILERINHFPMSTSLQTITYANFITKQSEK